MSKLARKLRRAEERRLVKEMVRANREEHQGAIESIGALSGAGGSIVVSEADEPALEPRVTESERQIGLVWVPGTIDSDRSRIVVPVSGVDPNIQGRVGTSRIDTSRDEEQQYNESRLDAPAGS